MENFFNNSYVKEFILKNSSNLDDSLIIDYDGRTYLRVMKFFTQNDLTFLAYNCSNDIHTAANKGFYLRVYLPKNIIGTVGGKIEKTVIMLNGMNELDHFHLYDIIGEYFANNGIAAILLPTPLHLNRRVSMDYEFHSPNDPIKPTVLAKEGKCDLFYLNYIKSYLELKYLIEKIQGINGAVTDDEVDDFNFYKHYFNGKATEITLLGYSLGGLKTLGYFLKDFKAPEKIDYTKKITVQQFEGIGNFMDKHKQQQLHCCITINSGPNLLGITASEEIMGMKPDEWLPLMKDVAKKLNKEKQLHKLIKRKIAKKEIDELINCFKYLYFNKSEASSLDANEYAQPKLEAALDNYLAISGGADKLVDTSAIQSMIKRQKETDDPLSINQIIIAKGDHHPSRDVSYWHEMLPSVERSMLDFINSCGEKHYTKKVILDVLEDLISQSTSCLHVLDKCQKKFHRTDFDILLKGYRGNKKLRQLLTKYYFISKAFYPNFPDVINKIRPNIIDKHLKSDA
jgi:hypothetical protein